MQALKLIRELRPNTLPKMKRYTPYTNPSRFGLLKVLLLPNRCFSKEFAGVLLVWKYLKLRLIVARCYW